MAKRKGDGFDQDITVTLLTSIRDELRQVRDEVREVRDEVRGVKGGLVLLNSKFDNLLQFAGERYRDHEERLRRIEGKIFG